MIFVVFALIEAFWDPEEIKYLNLL